MANITPCDYDRERGIFSERDRRFLAGELDDELTDNEKRQKRYRLRQRMFHSLQDLMYLRLMSARDIGQVADITRESLEFDPEDPEFDDPATHRRRKRLSTGLESLVAFYREMLDPEVFQEFIEGELEKRAALDHFDETGEFGVMDATVEVEQTGDLSISEVRDEVDEVFDDEGGSVSDLDEKYPGWAQVLNRAGEVSMPMKVSRAQDQR